MTHTKNVIKDALDDIVDLSANAESIDRATRTEKCLKISKVCEHGLEVLEDLCPAFSRQATLGRLGVSNYEC